MEDIEDEPCWLCGGTGEVPEIMLDCGDNMPPGGEWVDSGDNIPCPECNFVDTIDE